MNNANQTYSVIVIEIADYLLSHVDKNKSSIASVFARKYKKSERTIWRYISNAEKYNAERIKKQEKEKDKIFINEAKKAALKNIVSRIEALEILSSLIRGNARKIQQTEELIIPTDSERIKAIQQIGKMLGWGTDDLFDT
jgi:DNA-binding MurR/RpiR family transcriptional regulator